MSQKVLIVEDDPINMLIAERLLASILISQKLPMDTKHLTLLQIQILMLF